MDLDRLVNNVVDTIEDLINDMIDSRIDGDYINYIKEDRQNLRRLLKEMLQERENTG